MVKFYTKDYNCQFVCIIFILGIRINSMNISENSPKRFVRSSFNSPVATSSKSNFLLPSEIMRYTIIGLHKWTGRKGINCKQNQLSLPRSPKSKRKTVEEY